MDWLIGSIYETSSVGVVMIGSSIEDELFDVGGLGGVSRSVTGSEFSGA